jgi:predicted methyltransferase
MEDACYRMLSLGMMGIGRIFRISTMRQVVLMLVLLAAWPAAAEEVWQQKLAAAMAAPSRPDADRTRDANRLPLQTLEFFRFRDDMKVLELFPGSGWYTRLLAPVLAERGKLFLALGTGRVARAMEESDVLRTAEILDVGAELEATSRRGIYHLGPLSFWQDDLDLVLTFRNVHNLDAEGRDNLNAAVFEALRPGGLYGVVDHTRRHMAPDSAANVRRVDPVAAIHETLRAGFELVGYSDLHHRPGDDLSLEVGDERVSGRTDRFTLLFRKPSD